MVLEELDVIENTVGLLQFLQVDQTSHTNPRHEPIFSMVVRQELYNHIKERTCIKQLTAKRLQHAQLSKSGRHQKCQG